MNSTTPELVAWLARARPLLERACRTLRDAPTESIRTLADRIPVSLAMPDAVLRIVFAGQYSAGKSLILRVLTGRSEIAVGAGITTQTTTAYDWEGVEVIDTPGVHTELRPDHDDIAYRAIAEADLVVFVVTNEGFDAPLAEHFRRLAIDRGKAHEMLLVVNKMRRCATGNTPEARDAIRRDLAAVLAPFTAEQLRTTFIDAEAAGEGLASPDPELARILLRKSAFEDFRRALDEFIRDAGWAARYTTPLYVLEQVLQEALASEGSDDPDVDGLEELFVQRRRAVVEVQHQISRAIRGQVERCSAVVRDEGRTIAERIHGDGDPRLVDRELVAAQARVQHYASELEHALSATLTESIDRLAQRIGQIANSELARTLLPRLLLRLDDRLAGVDLSPQTSGKLRKASVASRRLGEFLIQSSFNPNSTTLAGLFRLNQYSGTATHGAIKAIGGYFGKSFKPWEAVKWTRAVANVGRVLAVSGTVLSFVLQVKEDVDAARLERELRESRSAVRRGFNEAAHEIETHFDATTRDYLDQTLVKELGEIDRQLAELREMREIRGKLFQDLVGLLEETRATIRDVHVDHA